MINNTSDIIIIGGGLAGLVSSLHHSLNGMSVVLFEPKKYPFHKVCGEYISKEVLPYLATLHIDPYEAGAVDITDFELTSPKGKSITTPLPLGGFSISRYTFDHHIYEKSKAAGTEFIHQKVSAVDFENDGFNVTTDDGRTFRARVVIGAFGKFSGLDNYFQRKFADLESRYIGVKYHAEMDHPEHVVALHNFQSGYCGVSKVENSHVNICYLTTLQNIREAGSLEALEKDIMSKNTSLAKVIRESRSVFRVPLTISNVSFNNKSQLENHILMTGDAAGMINPLSGNGMTMAIHSAKIATELSIEFLKGNIPREAMEASYSQQWKKAFRSRLFWGRQFQKMFGMSFLFEVGIRTMALFPGLFRMLIKQTHGKPF